MLRTRVTLPPNFKERLSPERINKAVEKHLDKSYDRIKSLYAETYATWEHKPKFVFEKKMESNGMRYKYYTEDEIYGYVHNGTKPHDIYPRGDYPLAFPWAGFPGAHEPRTEPRIVGSWGVNTNENGMYFFRHVNHPGIKPREFTRMIYEEIEPVITKQLFAELRR